MLRPANSATFSPRPWIGGCSAGLLDERAFESQWRPAAGAGWLVVTSAHLRCNRDGVATEPGLADQDRTANRCLICAESGCGWRTEPDEVTLTREQVLRASDILFTRRNAQSALGDARYAKLSGARTAAGVTEVGALDEAHYGGIQGAEAALLIHRWMHASRPHFVGLHSRGRHFFATLVGLSVGDSRAQQQIEQTGGTCGHAGRSGSGASVLSTSIQTAMLFAVLEPAIGGRAGVVGRKHFCLPTPSM